MSREVNIDEVIQDAANNGWNDMKNPPKDGTVIKLLVATYDMVLEVAAYWDDDPEHWQIWTDGEYEFCGVQSDIIGWKAQPQGGNVLE